MRFAVEDTGIGMTPAEMDRLFEPFYRVRSAGRRTVRRAPAWAWRSASGWPGGSGGDIAVESTPGEGSIFTLSIAAGSLGEAAGTP